MRMHETENFDSHDAHNAKEEGEGDKEKDNARGRLCERHMHSFEDNSRTRMHVRESKKERTTNVNSMSERVWYIGEKVC